MKKYIYIFHSGSRVGVINMVLQNGKWPSGSEDKWRNPKSHNYTLQRGHKSVGMEHKT